MTRRLTAIAFLSALIVSATGPAGLSAAALAAEPVVAPTPPAIRVVAAERRELVATLSVNGSIVAREEAAVGADMNGLTVLALNADIGDHVRKGDVLAVLDRSMLDTQLAQMQATRAQVEANVAQMQAQIADAKIAVRQAEEALERARALQKKGFTADAQLDTSVNAAGSARAKLSVAEKGMAATQAQLAVIDAQTRNVEVQIAKTELRAPADGLVLSRNATLGGVVMSASGPLFRIAIDSEFELAADVPEASLPKLSLGMPAAVRVAGDRQDIEGTIRRISPEVSQATRLGAIRIALKPDARVRSGNFARGEIVLARREGIAVPTAAVVYRGENAFLQLVEDGRIRTVPVRLGARADGMVEVVEGIAEGQDVVSRAGTFVADGDMVTPVRDDATGAITR